MNIGLVYRFGTFGGVERVLLERCRVLSQDQNVGLIYIYILEMEAAFLHFLEEQSRECDQLNKMRIAFSLEELESKCDVIFTIDTLIGKTKVPQFFENHSTYPKSFNLIPREEKVIVPSLAQKKLLMHSTDIKPKNIFVIENPLAVDWMFIKQRPQIDRSSSRNNFLWVSRIDGLKAHHAKDFSRACETLDDFKIHLVGRFALGKNAIMLSNIFPLSVLGRVRYYGEMNFAETDALLSDFALMSGNNFSICLSNIESFNLSSRAAGLNGLATIVPDLEVHRDGAFDCLYGSEGTSEVAKEISDFVLSYDKFRKSKKVSYDYDSIFLQSWNSFFNQIC
jgi:hypothetical protein